MPKESSLIISTSPSRTTPHEGMLPGLLMMKPPRRAATSRALRQPSMAFKSSGVMLRNKGLRCSSSRFIVRHLLSQGGCLIPV